MATATLTATTMQTEQLLTLAQWLSPAYPTGGFAWSGGLEAVIAEGTLSDGAGLARWLEDYLQAGPGWSDAVLLAAAWHVDPGALPELADLAAALGPSARRRAETLEQGAAFAAVTRAAWGIDLPDMAYPVAVGRAAALAGLPLEPVLSVFLHAVLSNQVAAAQRLMALGQTEAQTRLAGLAPVIADVAARAAPGDLDRLGTGAPMIDIAGMRQEALPVRVFRS